ncbi:ABC transporter permease [Reichenbachiella sp.]|uniref:ABC transporter permease n=1 Tax=Reichenbachiella sp. TaxID=2184521 RepID=UPI003BAE675E
MPRDVNIPKWPYRFFKWYCRKDRFEELHGDLEEFFYDRLEERNLRYARFQYTLDVFRCCRSYAWKKNSQTHSKFNQLIMFKNYFKTSMRSMMRNPLSSFINVFGLSVAIGICLIVYAFMDYEFSIDQHHENKNEVFLVTYFVDKEGETLQYGKSPVLLAEALKIDYPQVKATCRIEDRNVVVKYENKVFHEQVRYTDPDFLTMFTFPLKWGDPSTLKDLNSVIISEEMSEKYFGDVNPIGYDIVLKFDENIKKSFKVTGVGQAFPSAHQIEFDFLINFENFGFSHPDVAFNDWYKLLDATFVQVSDPEDIHTISAGMNVYRDLVNDTHNDWKINAFQFEQLSTLFEHSEYISESITYNYDAAGRITMPILGLFMLVLSCFNYINIAIVSAAKRLKEIAVRKTIGASRSSTVIQFLTENVLVTLLATVMGVFLATTVFLPWFVNLADIDLSIDLTDFQLWVYLTLVALTTGIVSGIYPAFYIAKFQAVSILKGTMRFGKKNLLTKVFLCIQLILVCVLITAAVVFTQNTAFQKNRGWGYNKDQVVYMQLPDPTSYQELYGAFQQNSNVTALCGSEHHLGHQVDYPVVHTPERKYETRRVGVSPEYFGTLGIELVEGRFFEPNHQGDQNAVVVNELLVQNFGFKDPIGESFKIDSVRYSIIGVVENFHIYSFYDKIRPTFFSLADPSTYQYLTLKVKPGTEYEMYDQLREQWAGLFPDTPFQGGHQADVWGMTYYEEEGKQGDFMRAVALVAVLLASLGFYGLVSLNVSGRVREFSIRKALGAGYSSIARQVTKQYLILIVLALLVGVPLSYQLVVSLLDLLYEYPMPVGIVEVVISIGILLLILFSVISTQVKKVFETNPVEGLKVE